jgi:hypothetical protein
MPESDPERGELVQTALVLAGFWGATTLAGALIGLLWPVRRAAAGAFALGYLAVGIPLATVGQVMAHFDTHWDAHAWLFGFGLTTAIFGTMIGRWIYRDSR